MKRLKITSREYKVMLDQRAFAERKAAVNAFWNELRDLADSEGIPAEGEFEVPKKRRIVFLDTVDFTLLRNGLVLRRRKDAKATEYTLKCRSEDRYVAAAAEVSAAEELAEDDKFEEDVAAPFHSRYSHSNTVAFEDDPKRPQRLGDAAKIFPTLARLRRDGATCPPETELHVVNNVRAYERVYTGTRLRLGDTQGPDAQWAEVALILWSHGKRGRPLVAEFSFRNKEKDEQFSASVAAEAMSFFEALQRFDWCRPGGMTKTQYVYRGGQGD